MRSMKLFCLAICAITCKAYAGDTQITKITKMAGPMMSTIVEVEGTNSLGTGEVWGSWTPSFVKRDGTSVPASIVTFTQPTPGGPAQAFKFRIQITGNNGTWTARSVIAWSNPVGGDILKAI